jgi:hypothetical protein
MFIPAQLFHNWHKQWPSNQVDLDLIVAGEAGTVYYTRVGQLLLLLLYATVVELHFIWYTQ